MAKVWNVDAAKPVPMCRPVTSSVAARLADMLERRTGDMHVVVKA